jgi:quercetin dioxygenase-like cupin family protein
MILKATMDSENPFRIAYDIKTPNAIKVHHFAVRTTTPDNPFAPHKHQQEELWYVIEGEGIYSEDGRDYPVEAGDLIQIHSSAVHGLRSETNIIWICLG